MGGRRRHEPTTPGNPRQLTINQHVHSKACIKRFANSRGLVAVLELSTGRTLLRAPANSIFCAQRVWDQRLEHGALSRTVEDAFLKEATSVIHSGTVANHDAITAYLSLWQIRARLDAETTDDVELRGISAPGLTKEQEEILESKHAGFARGNKLPARFAAGIRALPMHDSNMRTLAGTKWGVLRAAGKLRFISPDWPAGERYIVLTRDLALVGGYIDQSVQDETVDDANRQARDAAQRFIFGHPDDVSAFRARHGATRVAPQKT